MRFRFKFNFLTKTNRVTRATGATQSFAAISIVFLGLILASNPIRAAESASANRLKFVVEPLLQGASETSMTVTWITDLDSTGVVEYGEPGGELKPAFASQHGLIEANQRIHKIELRDLRPGTRYRYRVISREIVKFEPYRVTYGSSMTNEFREFQTFDRRKRDFSFLVFNDIHDQPGAIADLLKVAGKQPYEFVVWNGDILSYINKETQITTMLRQARANFAASVPLFWTRGNHETRGSFARQFPDYLALPDGEYYYTFEQGPVFFIVLDTGEDKRDSSSEYSGLVDFFPYRREQGEWLKRVVKSSEFQRAKFRVVLCHMPFASKEAAQSEEFVGMADAFENFGETLENAGVDLMISGHMHQADIVQPEAGRHSYPIVVGGGPRTDSRTIIRVNVTGAAVEATVIDSNGKPAFTCRVPAKR
jgi:UDP-2,3-diacylglucosamine pyrophosphatase LpxH